MKKNLLFVINNLSCGGAENALVALLEELDYSKYNVDLQLFKKEGFLLHKLNVNCTVLDVPKEFDYFEGSVVDGLIKSLKHFRIDVFLARLYSVYILKSKKSRTQKEQKIWKALRWCLPKLNKKYDVSISYLQNTPNYYNIDKVNADKKIGFIRTDYKKMDIDYSIDHSYFKKFDAVLSVSKSGEEQLKQIFPDLSYKFLTMESVFSYNMILKMSEEKISLKKAPITLISLGRLHPVKGFDLAIESCKILKNKGVELIWYVIGEGGEREKLLQLIKQNQVENQFVLLGLKENPHPYIKQSDIYVQTSRFEGKSRAIEEAKIHKKPIIVTNFPSVNDQIIHGQNGYIAEMSAESIAEGILNLSNDDELKIKLISNLQHTMHDNESQLKILYDLIEKTTTNE